jgi:hypothetical protein
VIVRAAWLYTRSKDSVRMEVREEPGRFLLMVYGPGEQSHHEVSTTYAEAMRAQGAFEEQFLARGFVLEGFDQPQAAPRAARAPRTKRADTPVQPEAPGITAGNTNHESALGQAPGVDSQIRRAANS